MKQFEITPATLKAFENLAGALDEFGLAVRQVNEAITPLILEFLRHVKALGELVERQLFGDEPFRYPGEAPVDYVLRVGRKSGWMIYPDEAWRYRNTDWWGKTPQDKHADRVIRFLESARQKH